jgi:hypothetical protein
MEDKARPPNWWFYLGIIRKTTKQKPIKTKGQCMKKLTQSKTPVTDGYPAFLEQLAECLTGKAACTHEPKEGISGNEKVLGVITGGRAKALYSLMVAISKEVSRLIEKAKGQQTLDEGTKIKLSIMREQHDIIKDIFFEAVHVEFPRARIEGTATGIRKGWNVVSYDEVDRNCDTCLARVLCPVSHARPTSDDPRDSFLSSILMLSILQG